MEPRAAWRDAVAGTKPVRRLVHRELLQNRFSFSVVRSGRLKFRNGRESQDRGADMLREQDPLRRLALFSRASQSSDSAPQNVESKFGEIENRAQRAARNRDVNATGGLIPCPIGELMAHRSLAHVDALDRQWSRDDRVDLARRFFDRGGVGGIERNAKGGMRCVFFATTKSATATSIEMRWVSGSYVPLLTRKTSMRLAGNSKGASFCSKLRSVIRRSGTSRNDSRRSAAGAWPSIRVAPRAPHATA